MQRAQFNYRTLAAGVALFGALIFAGNSAFSAGVADRGGPDPLLTDNPAGPCQPDLAGPDLADGTDVDGHPVAPANLASGPIPLKGDIEVPLKAPRGRAPGLCRLEWQQARPAAEPQVCL
jgi:hypothetical protein